MIFRRTRLIKLRPCAWRRKKKRPPKRPLSHLRTLVFVIAVGLGFVVRCLRLVDTGLLVLVVAGGGVLVLPVAGVVARLTTFGSRCGRLRRRGGLLGRGWRPGGTAAPRTSGV